MEVTYDNTNWALANAHSRFNQAKWALTTSQWVVFDPSNKQWPIWVDHYSNPTSSFQFPYVSL
jgi:hypothetical protein